MEVHWQFGVADAAVLRHGDDLYNEEVAMIGYDYEEQLDPEVWLF